MEASGRGEGVEVFNPRSWGSENWYEVGQRTAMGVTFFALAGGIIALSGALIADWCGADASIQQNVAIGFGSAAGVVGFAAGYFYSGGVVREKSSLDEGIHEFEGGKDADGSFNEPEADFHGRIDVDANYGTNGQPVLGSEEDEDNGQP